MTLSCPETITAVLRGNTIIVEDILEARCIYSLGFYGKPLGVDKPRGPDFEAPVRLDVLEALYLVEKGVLRVVKGDGAPVDQAELRLLGESFYKDFDTLYTIYRNLRDNGLVVRSGLKYGADFTVYREGPGLEHAPYVLHVYTIDHMLEPTDIVRAGRLSHSVKKTFIIATVGPDSKPMYLMLKWWRP